MLWIIIIEGGFPKSNTNWRIAIEPGRLKVVQTRRPHEQAVLGVMAAGMVAV